MAVEPEKHEDGLEKDGSEAEKSVWWYRLFKAVQSLNIIV